MAGPGTSDTREKGRIVIVGAGIAGCTAALLLARRGLRVTLVDQKPRDDVYKKLCTHFIQPVALPTIRKLGLEDDLRRLGIVTKAAFWTAEGWTDPAGDYEGNADPGASGSYALNLERRALDPFLLGAVRSNPAVEVRLGSRVSGLLRQDDGWTISLEEREGVRQVHAALLIGADGRTSRIARLAGIAPSFTAENERSCLFGYFDHCPAPAEDRSLFMLMGQGMIFYYPLPGARALISAFVPKRDPLPRMPHAERGKALLALLETLPHGLDLSRAMPPEQTLGYLDYPNQARPPAGDRMALIGDAALSLDPMSGVGCAFAMVSADLLADAVGDALANGAGLDQALAEYARGFARTLGPHIQGVCADSLDRKSPETVSATYRQINSDPALQRLFLALTGRLIDPGRFQRAFLLSAAARGAKARADASNGGGAMTIAVQ